MQGLILPFPYKKGLTLVCQIYQRQKHITNNLKFLFIHKCITTRTKTVIDLLYIYLKYMK